MKTHYINYRAKIYCIKIEDQVYSNTRVPTEVDTRKQEPKTRVKTNQHESLTRINTSPTQVNTNQHKSITSPTRANTNQHKSNMSHNELTRV